MPPDLTAPLAPDILASFTPQQLEDRGVGPTSAARNLIGM
jgi:hypothetical protein